MYREPMPISHALAVLIDLENNNDNRMPRQTPGMAKTGKEMRTRMYCGDSRAHECVSAARGWLLVMMNCVSWPLRNPLASPLGKAKHPNPPGDSSRTVLSLSGRRDARKMAAIYEITWGNCRQLCAKSMTGKRHLNYRKPVLRGCLSMAFMSSSETALLASRRTLG